MTSFFERIFGWFGYVPHVRLRDAEARAGHLHLAKTRCEAALRTANAYVFAQDRDLRYTWAYGPDAEGQGSELVGRPDEEVLPANERDAVIATKRRVLETGQPARCEVSYPSPDGRTLFTLHMVPSLAPDGTVDGIISTAVDGSRLRTLEGEQRRLSEQLASTVQRYETALRGSNVTVFTQDRDLRYTSISNPMFDLTIEQIIGSTDDDILERDSRAAVTGLKREALASGSPRDGEVAITQGGVTRTYDLHVEPLRDVMGAIVGLTCAAVDITERKEGEAHLRLLLRELTHRSKNLLAVIQAMARQTAKHFTSVDGFLDQFSARLQAMARSHDILVQESWYGASLSELVRSHLGFYLDRPGSQISVAGPSVVLKPEAAQSLGLALHELATNAAKYGALSNAAGRISISWRRLPPDDGNGLEIVWDEAGGPTVVAPERRGFGRMVVERNLARSIDGKVELTFPPEGVHCRIEVPATQLSIGR
jgi:PAS domain S-box-containing protein